MQLEAGGRRFFQGLVERGTDGRWHPIPNARLHAVLVGEVVDQYRRVAMQLASVSKLSEKHRRRLVDHLSGFMKAYADLKSYLSTPQAQGMSTSMKSTELDGLWWQYLSTGRRLLDFAGLHSRTALGHRTDIGGLNGKKMEVLKTALRRDPGFAEVLQRIAAVEPTLMHLIDIRNEEKDPGGTIREAPVISPEGQSRGGVVRIENTREELNFCRFLDESHAATIAFTKAVLAL